MYTAIKHIHMLCALLSITGFLLRAVWTFQQSPLLQKKVTKVLPHLIDTVFLGSAFTLAWLSSQYPFYAPWLTAKLFGLIAYIILGSYTLKVAKDNRQRAAYLLLALATYGYVAGVAITRNALFFLI
jgi:uncharacterized membrane protein SirB2